MSAAPGGPLHWRTLRDSKEWVISSWWELLAMDGQWHWCQSWSKRSCMPWLGVMEWWNKKMQLTTWCPWEKTQSKNNLIGIKLNKKPPKHQEIPFRPRPLYFFQVFWGDILHGVAITTKLIETPQTSRNPIQTKTILIMTSQVFFGDILKHGVAITTTCSGRKFNICNL